MSWEAFAEAATQAAASGQEFNGCRVRVVEDKRVLIERVATGSPVTITRAFVERSLQTVARGPVPRRSLNYTVAIESSLVNLHPRLDWSADGKTIELVA